MKRDSNSSSNSATYMNELNFDLMVDEDVRDCIKSNDAESKDSLKKYKSILKNKPTPLSELHKAS